LLELCEQTFCQNPVFGAERFLDILAVNLDPGIVDTV
jgi:hypothetical protein